MRIGGEIALRVMKTVREMGIATVAIYSDVDRKAPHVRFANEAVRVGPAPSSESYLQMDRIIQAAKDCQADAIHPGYGFLSENASFARKVEAAGLVFIGPKPYAIEVMGDFIKLSAKEAVKAYDIPLVPGTEEAITDLEEAKRIAVEIGFPILIKASAGGGGKGMRIVEKEADLAEQMDRAISEATSAFGNGAVFIEKYVGSPKHIEIQILADSFGNTVHLFERDCSIQRRHQKVVEEAPSAVLSPELRQEMGATAVQVAKACDYVGAGTVEFLLDEAHNFYFLEMNTRLQVEHPVTEMITGIDLVEQQIRIARGEALSFRQEDLSPQGHSIELRVYAEDPFNEFLPSVGTLSRYTSPSGTGIRVDGGYEEGMEIPIYYDPMIAKLITYAPTREGAIQRMKEAIADYSIEGIASTLAFGKFVCDHPAFREGQYDTHFVKTYYSKEAIRAMDSEEKALAAKVGLLLYLSQKKNLQVPQNTSSEWRQKRIS